jgi:hypothetical protein
MQLSTMIKGKAKLNTTNAAGKLETSMENLASATNNLTSYPIAIPQGFQLISNLNHIGMKADIESVLYMPVSTSRDRFATYSAGHYIHVWEGNNHVKKIDLKKDVDLLGMKEWIYIQKWGIVVISTSRLELKV